MWFVSQNELSFMNSLKMKIAVILGVGHMCIGIVMRGLNNLYFNQYLDIVVEVIPQMILLLSLFGFMDLMIIIKWLTDYS